MSENHRDLVSGFIDGLGMRMQINKFAFGLSARSLLMEYNSDYRRVALFNIAFDNKENLSIDRAKFVIADALKQDVNFKIKNSLLNGTTFNENVVHIDLTYSIAMPADFTYKAKLLKEINNNCLDEFWSTSVSDPYHELIAFEPFLKFKIDNPAQIKNHPRTLFYYDAIAWQVFYRAIISTCFPEFNYSSSLSKKGLIVFTKQIAKDIIITIEYNERRTKRTIEYEDITFPTLNISLIADIPHNPILNKSLKKSDSSTKIALGLLGNPFFHHPCIPLSNFSSIESSPFFKTGEFCNVIENSESGMFINGPKNYGKRLQQQAVFYVWLLSKTSRSYIEFLEKSILEVLISG